MKSRFFTLSTVQVGASILSASLAPIVATAQSDAEANGGSLEVVLVTAQRREQALADVPISMEALSGEAISQQGFVDVEAMSKFSPSLNINASNQNNQGMRMRGVGTDSNSLSIEQAVPIFIDGVVFGRGSNAFAAFLDIQRVEVLKGPQPIYFGQNATAGAISIVSRRPGDTWEGYVQAEAGSNNRISGEGAVGGPLSDSFGIRLAGKYEEDEGFMTDAITGNPFPRREAKAGRVMATWKPTEQLGIVAKVETTNVLSGGRAIKPVGITPRNDVGMNVLFTDAFTGVSWAHYDLDRLNRLDNNLGIAEGPSFLSPPRTVIRGAAVGSLNTTSPIADLTGIADQIDFTSRGDMDLTHGFMEINYEFANEIALTGNSGFSMLDRTFLQQFGGGGPFIFTSTERFEDVTQLSQELRLTSPSGGFLEWVGGVYYQTIEMETGSRSYRSRLNPAPSFGGTISHNNGIDHQEDDTWLSAFANFTFNIVESFSIDAGARWTKVEKDGGVVGLGSLWTRAGVPILPAPGSTPAQAITQLNGARPDGVTPWAPTGESIAAKFEDTNVSPQVVLRWRPTADLSLYAKYAESFKAGGFDSSVSQVITPVEAFVFDSEFSENYEIGARATFLNGRLVLNGTLFENTFSDMQVSAFNDALLTTTITNVAEQRVRGLEFDGQLRVTDDLSLSLSGALMDGEIVKFPGAPCTTAERDFGLCTGPGAGGTIDRSGQDSLYTPDWSAILGVDYSRPVTDSLEISFNANYLYSSGYETGYDQVIGYDAYDDLSLNLGIGTISGSWRVAAYARNVLEPLPSYRAENDRNILTGFGGAMVSLSASNFASYGVQLRVNFGQ
jgi:iron complex outermembrane receptor protein